jgi:carboxymethylenebutenolidase
MAQREITVKTPDGPMKAFIVQPDGDGPFPVVIQFMDAGGVRDELRDMARTYSGAGVLVVLPDLYHRFGEDISFDANEVFSEGGEEKRAEMFGLVTQLKDDAIMGDVRALLDQLQSDPAASDGPKGCVGYCVGGRTAVNAMAAFPDQFVAGAAMHPSGLVTDQPDSPHRGISRIKGELYFGLGGDDFLTPPPVIAAVEEELKKANLTYTIDITPGATHGFALKGRAESYNPEADRLHYERTLDLITRRLVV